MASPALFAIRRGEQTRVFFGGHMADVTLYVFARGPNYAETIVTDLTAVTSLEHVEAGFMLDFDQRVALLFDAGVCWDADEARVNGWMPGAMSRGPNFERLDLRPEERCLIDVVSSSLSVEEFVAGLKSAPLTDSWRDWELRWGTCSDFLAAVAAGPLLA